MPRRSSFAMASSEGMTQVSGSMAVPTITGTTEEGMEAASAVFWAESSAGLEPATNNNI